MKVLVAVLPTYDDDYLDSILSRDCPTAISDLELLDLLIARAKETGVEVSVRRDNSPTLTLDMAYRLRYEMGQEIRR